MRIGIVVCLTALMIGANGRADPIRYEQIPTDVMSYLHFDMDRFLGTRVVKDFAHPGAQEKLRQLLGGNINSVTVYFLRGQTIHTVFLIHGDSQLCACAQAYAAQAKDKVVIKYEDQDVYYSTEGLMSQLQLVFDKQWGTDNSSSPQARKDSSQPHDSHGLFNARGSFSFGLDAGQGDMGDAKLLAAGPSYKAFVGSDLIVATADIGAMAKALDVLRGKEPSLAKQDPLELKGSIPPGAVFIGAGFTAQVASDSAAGPNSTSRPADVTPGNGNTGGGFGLNMFTSFKGKARVARLNIGEDDQSDYINASISMVDQDSSEQLRNLILGIKALVTLSQAKQAPLIAPLDVRAEGKDVLLHWSWPTAKLSEFVRLAQNNGDRNAPTSAPVPDSAR